MWVTSVSFQPGPQPHRIYRLIQHQASPNVELLHRSSPHTALRHRLIFLESSTHSADALDRMRLRLWITGQGMVFGSLCRAHARLLLPHHDSSRPAPAASSISSEAPWATVFRLAILTLLLMIPIRSFSNVLGLDITTGKPSWASRISLNIDRSAVVRRLTPTPNTSSW